MHRIIAAIVVTMSLASFGRSENESARHIVLPNSKLLGCRSSGCAQLWQDAGANGIYPRQVTVDIFGSDSCPRGVLALYEKSVSVNEVQAAVDQRYGRWALPGNANSPVKLWRVEPEKFAIQLAVTEDRTAEIKPDEALGYALGLAFGYGERSNVAEAGMKQLIYIAFVGMKCGPQ